LITKIDMYIESKKNTYYFYKFYSKTKLITIKINI